MLRSSVLFLSVAAILAGCQREESGGNTAAGGGGAAPVPGSVEATLPPLKAGRWRTTTLVVGSNEQAPPVTACISDAAQRANVAMAERLGSLSCSERWVRREGEAIVSHAVCKVDGATQTFDTRATGDFATDFFIESKVMRDPPLAGGAAEYRTTVHSRWMGKC